MWMIVDADGRPIGRPNPLLFKTKKEARERMMKIIHQAGGGLGELSLKKL